MKYVEAVTPGAGALVVMPAEPTEADVRAFDFVALLAALVLRGEAVPAVDPKTS